MRRLPDDASDDERHAALLHDVLEDTDTRPNDLREAGYSEVVVAMVLALTRNPDEPYLTYVAKLAGSPAERIKRADLADNSDPERLGRLHPALRDKLRRKYAEALKCLGPSRPTGP
jgi:(p)ppGpp synthase/HD superfamily hydrolase